MASANAFARNVAILSSGTIVAQGLTVLCLPFLTRLYRPEDFSLLAVYTALLGILTVASCLRFNIAISIPGRDEEGASLTVLSILSSLVLSIALGGAAIIAPEHVSRLIGQQAFQPYLWLIPIGVLLSSVYSALQYWSSRQRRFGEIATTRMTRALSGVGTQLGIGLAHPSPFGLLFGHFVFNSMGALRLIRSIWRHDRAAFAKVNGSSLKAAFLDYRRFPIYSVPEALLNTAAMQVPVLLIAAALAPAEAGFLMLAMRVLALPVSIIGQSVAQVYLAEAPDRLRSGVIGPFTRRTMWSLLKLGAPPLIALGIVSPVIFPLIFGDEWGTAGWIVAWMTPWFVLQFVSSPISMLLHVVGRQGTAMMLQAFGCILRVGSVLLAVSYTREWTIEVYAVSGALFYGVYVIILDRLARATSPALARS